MRYRRHINPANCYFFTVVTAQRRPLLIDHIEWLKRAIRITRERHPFRIDAIVVLPDHLHTIWTLPTGDTDRAMRWRVLKRLFSCALASGQPTRSQGKRRENGIWQRRFWERCIRTEDDRRNHLEYIHLNPVKHGYCSAPVEWPYSSFRRAVGTGEYAAGWGRREERVG